MNAFTSAQNAYSSGTSPSRSMRSVEYDLLSRVTQKLKAVSSDGKDDFPQLAQALYENQKVWTLFAADLAEPGNALPDALKANLLYLYKFTQTQSQKVLERSASPDVLVEVNMAVMRGLRGSAGGAV